MGCQSFVFSGSWKMLIFPLHSFTLMIPNKVPQNDWICISDLSHAGIYALFVNECEGLPVKFLTLAMQWGNEHKYGKNDTKN